jgi:hypothetical protein
MKSRQQAHLEVISRTPGAPERDVIINALKAGNE